MNDSVAPLKSIFWMSLGNGFVAEINCGRNSPNPRGNYGIVTATVVGVPNWVGLLVGAGYAFGNAARVGAHLTAGLLGIVALSILPGFLGWFRSRAARSKIA